MFAKGAVDEANVDEVYVDEVYAHAVYSPQPLKLSAVARVAAFQSKKCAVVLRPLDVCFP